MAAPPIGPMMGGNGDYRMQDGMLQSSAAAGISQETMPVPDMLDSSVTVSATPSGQRLFQCGHCNRSYTRLDHLARHVRSHTLEKPFLCHVCSKRFSRADLLKRHATNHTAEAVSKKRQRRQHTPTHPGRVTQACRACALAKLKCEEEKPCRRCQTKDLACEYSSSDGVKIRRTSQAMHTGGQSEAEMEDSIHVGSREDSELQSEMMDGENQYQPQVMTPDTTAQESSIHPQEERGFEFDESSFADFLKDVMMPVSFSPFPGVPAENYQNQAYTPRDVLNFGIDTNLELDDIDFGLLNSYNGKGLLNSDRSDAGSSEGNQSHEGIPDMKKRLSLGIEAFKRSLWRYDPGRQHTGTAEHDNLSIPTGDMDSPGTRVRSDMRVINERIDQSTRDKILAMTLKMCPPDKVSRVVASFPTAELLDNFMHMYFASRISNVDSWIHPATFKPKSCHPELVGAVTAAGATLTPIHTVRKLGYALQEAVRMSIPLAIEQNNVLTRDIQILQAYVMHLDIGAWSGNRRKMEMAESFGGPVTTMLRRNGKFRRSAYTTIVPRIDDEGETLDAKWRKWVEQESFKRLVFHLFLHDQELSISFLVNPLMSYAEMCLPVPAARDLWLAKNPAEWKALYLRRQAPIPERWPCLADCNHDMALLREAEQYIDMPLSHSIILHRIWGLIWEYRQINSVSKGPFREGNGALVLQSRHQELCQSLHRFRMSSTISSPDGLILLELLLMSLHVSLEDLQLFAGKEGEEEARRVFPLLQQWVQSRDSRQAVWHAGQIIRAAKMFPRGQLRDFYAVALYHASLAFWAYGIVSRVRDRAPPEGGPQSPVALTSNNSHVSPVEALTIEPIWLDGPDTLESQRFVALERGIPGVRGVTPERHALLEDPRAMVYVVLEIFSENVDEPPPPLVENLSQLMRELGNAAWAVHSGQQSRGDYVY